MYTESYIVSYDDNSKISIGSIQEYLHITNCNCKKMCDCDGQSYALIKKYKTINPFTVNIQEASLNFIHQCTEIVEYVYLINVNNLKDVCFHIQFEDINCICEPVNVLEFE